MCAEADEADFAAVLLLPRVQLLSQEENRLPQRPAGARRAASTDLDDRSRNLDHARIEVDRSAGGQVIRASGAVHHLDADEILRSAENVLRLYGLSVESEREFRFHPDRGELNSLARLALVLRRRLLFR